MYNHIDVVNYTEPEDDSLTIEVYMGDVQVRTFSMPISELLTYRELILEAAERNKAKIFTMIGAEIEAMNNSSFVANSR